jgi:signal transduction histidine kinase/ligand-binding sensor domain-containing protein
MNGVWAYMKMLCSMVILLTIFSVCPSFAVTSSSLSSNLLFHYITFNEGLPNNKVNAITSDKYGFMWFGTNDGVCRYDGKNIKMYALDNFKGITARTQQINVLKTSRGGDLFIGSYTLFKYNYKLDKVEPCDSLGYKKGRITIDRVRAIEPGEPNQFWVGATNGLFLYYNQQDSAIFFSYPKASKLEVVSLCYDNGILWIGTSANEILMFDTKKFIYSDLPNTGIPKSRENQALCLYKGKDDLLWIGTDLNGIFQIDTKTWQIANHIYPNKSDSYSYRVRKITGDVNGKVWIGCRTGLYYMKSANSTPQLVADENSIVSKLSSNSIFDIYIDQTDIIWIGTLSGGISYANMRRKPFYHFLPIEQPSLRRDISVNCFCSAGTEQTWIGTEDDGLFLFDHQTQHCIPIKLNRKENPESSFSAIKALAYDKNGNLWIGYYNGGIDQYNVKKQTIRHFEKSQKNSISDNVVRDLILDNEENLWVATNAGIDFLAKGSQNFEPRLYGKSIRAFYLDCNNNFWALSTGKGLYLWDRQNKTFQLKYSKYFNSTLISMLVDSNNNLWVGNKKGLYFIDTKTDSLRYFGIEEGLPSLLINSIIEDNQKNLWINTSAGFIQCKRAVADPSHLDVKRYTAREGLQDLQFIENSCFKDNKGNLFFGGKNGFNFFDPVQILENPYPPKLAFTNLWIFNNPVNIGEKIKGSVVLKQALNQTKELELSYKHSIFTLEFVALDFSNPEKVNYRYKLSPIEKEWNYSGGNRNLVSYSNLKGGNYKFTVEASNSDGIWSPTPLTLNIRVIPPFWKTILFNILIAILAIILLVDYYYYRIFRLERYNKQLEAKVDERTQELQNNIELLKMKQSYIELQTDELHEQKEQLVELNLMKDKFLAIIAHDLKNPFQSIIGFSKMLHQNYDGLSDETRKKYIAELSRSTNKVFNLLENLLTWSRSQTEKIEVKPVALDLVEITHSSLSLANANLQTKNISVETSFATDSFAMGDKNMIETVVRNLISNAVKYTSPNGKIVIETSSSNGMITYKVADNGVGIKPSELEQLFKIDQGFQKKGTNGEKGTGLGLIICKEFIEKNNGTIRVESKFGEGSTFTICLPVYHG